MKESWHSEHWLCGGPENTAEMLFIDVEMWQKSFHCITYIFNAVILKTMLFLVPAGHSYVSLRSFEVMLYILHLSALTQDLPPFCVPILE